MHRKGKGSLANAIGGKVGKREGLGVLQSMNGAVGEEKRKAARKVQNGKWGKKKHQLLGETLKKIWVREIPPGQ